MQPIAYVALVTTLLASIMGFVSGEETKNTYVDVSPHSANGTCSSQPVTGLEFSVIGKSSAPLASVFAVNKATYDAALSSNLTDAQIAQQSTQFSKMACYTPGTEISMCYSLQQRNTPKLDAQVMCILLTNARDIPTGAFVSYTWLFNNESPSRFSTDPNGGTSSSTSLVASSVVPLVMGGVLLALTSSIF
ncbi:MAG: hypothetical protein DHS80DRAFT_26193 [Piptocephalis tieghemiana]|nr:MAG: hypothetical protein DHS80DRAFT_26193 [Piptocephalis tieghemiana]